MPLRRRQSAYSEKESSFMENVRSNTMVACRNEFISKTDKRAISGETQRMAKSNALIKAKTLQQKRERLREILSTEYTFWQHELDNNLKATMESELIARETRLFGLKTERERQRKKFAEDMRINLLINSCDEIRLYARQKLHDEYKNCQLLQIEDNNIKKLEHLDQSRLWNNVQRQVFDQMTQREADEFFVARNRNLQDQQILKKQITEKNFIAEKNHEEDTMNWEKFHHGATPINDEENIIHTKIKQRQLFQDLLSQQKEKARIRKDDRNGEIQREMELINADRYEIMLAKDNIDNEKRRNMRETLHFLDYMKNIENEKLMIEREKDIITENLKNRKDNEYLIRRRQFLQQRNEFNKSIHQERWKQIIDRKDKLQQERIYKMNEISKANTVYANNARMEREMVAKKRNFRRQYGQELKAQCNYEQLLKNKAAADSNKLMQNVAKEETAKSILIKDNIGRMHESFLMHPNFKAIVNSKH